MTTPTMPVVQFRTLSLAELARKAWGKEWNKPDVAYEFTGNRKFESTDSRESGIYSPEHE